MRINSTDTGCSVTISAGALAESEPPTPCVRIEANGPDGESFAYLTPSDARRLIKYLDAMARELEQKAVN